MEGGEEVVSESEEALGKVQQSEEETIEMLQVTIENKVDPWNDLQQVFP